MIQDPVGPCLVRSVGQAEQRERGGTREPHRGRIGAQMLLEKHGPLQVIQGCVRSEPMTVRQPVHLRISAQPFRSVGPQERFRHGRPRPAARGTGERDQT